MCVGVCVGCVGCVGCVCARARTCTYMCVYEGEKEVCLRERYVHVRCVMFVYEMCVCVCCVCFYVCEMCERMCDYV